MPSSFGLQFLLPSLCGWDWEHNMKWYNVMLLCSMSVLLGAAIVTFKKEPACPDNLPIRVYDLERKTLTCFPPPLLYGQGRKAEKKEI